MSFINTLDTVPAYSWQVSTYTFFFFFGRSKGQSAERKIFSSFVFVFFLHLFIFFCINTVKIYTLNDSNFNSQIYGIFFSVLTNYLTLKDNQLNKITLKNTLYYRIHYTITKIMCSVHLVSHLTYSYKYRYISRTLSIVLFIVVLKKCVGPRLFEFRSQRLKKIQIQDVYSYSHIFIVVTTAILFDIK